MTGMRTSDEIKDQEEYTKRVGPETPIRKGLHKWVNV